ncbi:hypothetical protein [Bdellovibrio sp. KM01]|uniref:hypothetical protein n=1 Tax=Bdellovibrio sp. KM01 TaxID=2748865 RepID=UPI0015E96ACA|nr:hypothetical protein [Bdellovibrio sp. KM01]QLY24409.1 hypothetical protein HW988_13190 [Bdellovibrio sp. KM01]
MKWIVLILTVFSLSYSHAEEDLPLPLPEDPGQEQPTPHPRPQPPPYPAPEDPQPPQYPQPPQGQSRDYSLGAGDTGRFKERTFTFYPNSSWRRVTRVGLTGTRNNVKIKSVDIMYADYPDTRFEYNLVGELVAGSSRNAYLEGRPISAIRITATNKYFWKKPGGFRVDVTAYK